MSSPLIFAEAPKSNFICDISTQVLTSIDTCAVTANDVLNVNTFMQQQLSTRATTSYYLSVPIISQPSGTNICWAIAITSIANYIFNGSWKYSNIVDMFTAGVDKAQTIEQVIYNFNYYFNVNYTYAKSSTLSTTFLLNKLLAGYPLYGAFSRTGGAHAVVIRGVNTSSKTFSVMNPTPTTTGYTSGTISSSNVWTFVSAYSGSRYTLFAYGYRK